MPYSVIIGDTRGVPSPSHVRPAAFFLCKVGHRGVRCGMCAKLRKDIRAAAAAFFFPPEMIRVRATWWCARVLVRPRAHPRVCRCVDTREFHVRRCTRIRGPREKDIIGEGHGARDSNLQGCAWCRSRGVGKERERGKERGEMSRRICPNTRNFVSRASPAEITRGQSSLPRPDYPSARRDCATTAGLRVARVLYGDRVRDPHGVCGLDAPDGIRMSLYCISAT